jgi:hypothetical protein
MPKQVNINYGNKLEFFCEGDNSAKKTKRVILKNNDPISFSIKCVPSSKKNTRRKNSTDSVSPSSKTKKRKKSSGASGTSTIPTDNKPQSIIQALKKGDYAAFPHPIVDGLYLGYESKMQPPIKTKAGKRNRARRIAIEKREKQRVHIRSFLKKNPELQRIHNLMIADSTYNNSLPNIIKELQKKNPNTTLSSLIASAKKLQKNRISMLKSQSLQALSSPTSISSAMEEVRPPADDFATSVSIQGGGEGGRRFQKTRSKTRKRTKRRKRKRKKKKTRQKKKRRTTKKRQH